MKYRFFKKIIQIYCIIYWICQTIEKKKSFSTIETIIPLGKFGVVLDCHFCLRVTKNCWVLKYSSIIYEKFNHIEWIFRWSKIDRIFDLTWRFLSNRFSWNITFRYGHAFRSSKIEMHKFSCNIFHLFFFRRHLCYGNKVNFLFFSQHFYIAW